ncbi:Fic family protein [Luteipulveratus sp. YIM 133132]|uniref:Fic/DOC family protein n=1 Tax=Luteipulveratus flavus TaxID=3031728 RepID=UPI0023B11C2D|nr:Fic family protein [Luteipulveratus sp. YIM 133132]MDE9363979.1 Fic family protein [Luteipulveratus sp. YIM 133132]
MATSPVPWTTGTEQERWEGYFDLTTWDPTVGAHVLRNRVGATTWTQLRTREDAAFGVRALTLRTHGLPRAYDLEGLQAIHRHLFQDVYDWAGDLRTVGITKGVPFANVEHIPELMAVVAEGARSHDHLRDLPDERAPEAFASLYHALNTAHPFREGNGRTQREFLTALADESGRFIDWSAVHGRTNDFASEEARRGDMRFLNDMFSGIVTRRPSPTPATVPSLSERVSRILDTRPPAQPAAPATRYYERPGAGAEYGGPQL